MTKITDSINAICDLIAQKVKDGYGITSPQAKQLKSRMEEFEKELAALQVFPHDWTHNHSIGKGNLASVMWVVFLPPGQTTQDGIYVGFCFGKDGNGLVAGCTISNTSKKKYEYVKTVERKNPQIDVNGTRPGTHYNDGFVNPLEVLRGAVDDAKLKKHIQESIEQCEYYINLVRTTVESRRNSLPEGQDLSPDESVDENMKDEKPRKYDVNKRKKIRFMSGDKEDELLLRLLAALRAKPFAILAGHSGTGKSRYAKKLAYMTCNAVELRKEGRLPGNYLLLQVRPNWHDSTELLGFRNAMDGNRYQKTKLIEFLFRAYQFKETPFFLCLDEMNLAPVEQYFAEFLSSMESAEPVPLNDLSAEDDNLFELGCEWKAAYEHLAANGFSIPRNLFVVGTVNMDETTNQFSRKVLDRAFTIEMTDVDFRNYGHVAPPGYGDTIGEEMIRALLHGEKFVETLDPEDVADGAPLVRVQKALEPTAFAIAYRFANEYTLLKRAIACFDPSGAMKLDALDQAVLMKILPRVAGERDYIEQVYGRNENEGLRKALEGKAVSLGKIAEIMKRARDMNAQYITFWP